MADLPTVRCATRQDEGPLMEMCRRLHAENGLFSFSEAKVGDLIGKALGPPLGTIIGVIGEEGALQASTCLVYDKYYYTEEWHLGELWNFVDKDHRKSRNAEALVNFGDRLAKKMGCPFVTGIITNKQMAGKVRLYRRLLGYAAGAFFITNSKWRSEPMEDHSELRGKLREFAQLCNERKVTYELARQKIGPLLREAAEAIGSEDNVWGSAKKPANGAAAVVGS